ncbi:MAG TPA: hypothetical protein VK778_03865 [Solirubrobacteraceae bacterium]|jgi:hypothetical protein|nr:hypothetical protein [Solirubrobacteraceae bacterium]
MTGRIPKHTARLAAALFAASALAAVTAGSASAALIYDNIPAPLPAGMNSWPFQAEQTSQFGGLLRFEGEARKNPTVTVGMSSWACQQGTWQSGCVSAPGATFPEEVTLSIYEAGPGGEPKLPALKSVTLPFQMPYRPSASAKKCKGENAGNWYHRATANVPFECFNEKAFKITFRDVEVTLPQEAIIGVAYDTSQYGPNPKGTLACESEAAGCPYDALNVAVRGSWELDTAPTVGHDPLPGDVYLDSTGAGNYCENASAVGTFAISQNCWTGEQPAIEVKASKK